MRNDILGLVSAAGMSTKTRGVALQKAAVTVKWEGKTAPLVVHQVMALKELVDKVYVAVNCGKNDVLSALDMWGVDCEIVTDKKVSGLAMVWRQFLQKVGTHHRFISVNVDDLHSKSDWKSIAEAGLWQGISVTLCPNASLIDKKCAYDVYNNRIVKAVGKKSGRSLSYIGTGIYIIDGDAFMKTYMVKNNGEYEPEPMLNQMIQGKETFWAYHVNGWYDAGEESSLRRIMVRDNYEYGMAET